MSEEIANFMAESTDDAASIADETEIQREVDKAVDEMIAQQESEAHADAR